MPSFVTTTRLSPDVIVLGATAVTENLLCLTPCGTLAVFALFVPVVFTFVVFIVPASVVGSYT